MAQNSEIQQLLAAEEKASKWIQEAKMRKQERMKQAKEEAKAEIQKIKAEKEKQFKEYENLQQVEKEKMRLKIEEETKLKIEEMNKAVSRNQDNVVKKILELVYDIKPVVHYNYKGFKGKEKK